MDAYSAFLALHSLLRWVVLALLVVVVVRAARRGTWSGADEGVHVAAVASVDLQLLVGLVLYVFLSPLTAAFFAEPGPSMRDSTLRFFGVEHLTSMLLGIVALHVGRARSKRVGADARKRTVLRWTGAALVCVLVGIPWPFLPYARPVVRGVSAEVVPTAACPPTYAARCGACHGSSGRGDGIAAATLRPAPRDFSDPTWPSSRSAAEVAAIVREGGGPHGLSVAMPAHPDLTDEELDALLGCLGSFSATVR